MAVQSTKPPASALQELLTTSQHSCLETDAQKIYHQLSLQIAHNLRYQHNWSDVRIHASSSSPNHRPTLSGLPPTRLYVHPDEQVEFLQQQAKRAENASVNPGVAEAKLSTEREWVLPSHLRERWSLRRFAEAFDGLAQVPSSETGAALFDQDDVHQVEAEDANDAINPWRTKLPKRLLLATLDDDSSVVYYIVHDGIVKPRQN